ncbi:hypothetical protein ZIOFF_069039 [Zingiber officinale]|uniref:Uncharacterized protein n=1 Tax=Zingiber officinale TaxID=94328 RepID=A0A8J5C3K4_ZINOF|nr:hypothetical protein ZIOFF_069039 [Zingiber officinale]
MSGKELASVFFILLLNFSTGTFYKASENFEAVIYIINLEKVHITSISYDEKNGTVTVAGVFDPDRLSKKLLCRAGKVIKKIEEKKAEEKKKEEKKEEQKEEKKKEENKKEKKEEKKEEKKKENREEKKEEKKEEEEKKQEEEKKTEEKKKPPKPGIEFEPVVVTPYFWPPGVAICCHQPYLESHLGGCRCCTCGTVTENQKAPAPPASYPPTAPYSYPLPYNYKTCQFVCEEDPSAYCTVM